MKTTRLLLLSSFACLFCLSACSPSNSSGSNALEEVVLPDAFKNTNFCIVAGNWNESGAALIFNDKLVPEIQNGSSHVEFYDIEFEAKPLRKQQQGSKTMYFLPFKCTDQVIDDGYFKDNNDYKFWLSYENSTYYCGLSKDDDSLKEPELVLTEGLM